VVGVHTRQKAGGVVARRSARGFFSFPLRSPGFVSTSGVGATIRALARRKAASACARAERVINAGILAASAFLPGAALFFVRDAGRRVPRA